MITPRTLAYFDKTKGAFKPLKAAHNFKEMKERVALLWGDEVFVIAVEGDKATVSTKGHPTRRWTTSANEQMAARECDGLWIN